jgi:indole-3-glycerol phosphate synthase
MANTSTGTYLDRILANTIDEVRERMTAQPVEALIEMAGNRPDPVSLADALTATQEVSIIAEFKRASPSRGKIASAANPAEVIPAYVAGGCAAISVLTDERFFQGSLSDLQLASSLAGEGAARRPVLRKDFVVSPYQIVEARAHGADAVLLIVAGLSDDQLAELHGLALEHGLEAVVEVHDESELERALTVDPKSVGINNRDLRSFNVDLATTEHLAPLVPDGIAVVGESGVGNRDDVLRLRKAGVDAVLVGESLMRQTDRAEAVRELLGQ